MSSNKVILLTDFPDDDYAWDLFNAFSDAGSNLRILLLDADNTDTIAWILGY